MCGLLRTRILEHSYKLIQARLSGSHPGSCFLTLLPLWSHSTSCMLVNVQPLSKKCIYIKFTVSLKFICFKRWYWWTYLQGKSGDADIGNRLLDTVGEGECGTNWESSLETYSVMYKIDRQWGLAVWCGKFNPGLCDNLEGWDGVGHGRETQEGRDICLPVADSHWCMAEASTYVAYVMILQQKNFLSRSTQKAMVAGSKNVK